MKGGRRQSTTEKVVGRQHQGMDRPAVRQVQEGSGEQRKMEETGRKIIRGAPTTLAVKRLMMMTTMMMMMMSGIFSGAGHRGCHPNTGISSGVTMRCCSGPRCDDTHAGPIFHVHY